MSMPLNRYISYGSLDWVIETYSYFSCHFSAVSLWAPESPALRRSRENREALRAGGLGRPGKWGI